jgi:hypothetical protein
MEYILLIYLSRKTGNEFDEVVLDNNNDKLVVYKRYICFHKQLQFCFIFCSLVKRKRTKEIHLSCSYITLRGDKQCHVCHLVGGYGFWTRVFFFFKHLNILDQSYTHIAL